MTIVYLFIAILTISILTSCIGTFLRVVIEERRLDWEQVSTEFREIGALVYIIFTYIPGWFSARPYHNPHPKITHRPILLVPGYGLNRMSMYILATYLKRLGYEWVWCINHPVLEDDIHAFARALDEKIRWYCHYTQCSDISIIAHSMGGIVSELAYRDHNSPIAKLITLGTPWKGSKIHMLGIGKHVHQLAPQHPTIKGLTAPRIPHLALWGQQDWILLPNHNAIIKDLNHQELPHIGHISFLMNSRSFSLIHQFLNDKQKTTDNHCNR